MLYLTSCVICYSTKVEIFIKLKEICMKYFLLFCNQGDICNLGINRTEVMGSELKYLTKFAYSKSIYFRNSMKRSVNKPV
ncbi:MAG: hypothetical protein BWY70_01083 [Bacteroidetes bacterium ADurb.Bin408]|nr:MAG: hypothetical protein BWY70_01083 [Bacteroidetes bacterium ADurb.Bin408]